MVERRRIIRDSVYGYLRVDPIPSAEELTRYYKDRYYSDSTVFRDFTAEPKPEELEHFAGRCEDIFGRIRSHFGRAEGLSLFDVGCGYGHLVRFFAEKGLKASGVEPSRDAAEYAAASGLDVECREVERVPLAPGRKFDVVVFMDVLEHLREPWRMLQYARAELLKAGGLLVVDVPNDFNDFQTAADAAYGLNQWWVTPPIHINYFSGTSIRSLLEQCGYRVKWLEGSFPFEMFLLMGETYVGNAELGRECHRKRVLFERNLKSHGKRETLEKLYESLAALDLGRQVVAYAIPA